MSVTHRIIAAGDMSSRLPSRHPRHLTMAAEIGELVASDAPEAIAEHSTALSLVNPAMLQLIPYESAGSTRRSSKTVDTTASPHRKLVSLG